MSAPTQPPLRSKRRPKLTARYRSFQNKIVEVMPNDDSSHDDDSRRTSLLRTGKHAHADVNDANDDNDDSQNQNSDVQTTAPSSPYDADEEDEGEPEHCRRRKRKRRSTTLSRPLAKLPRRISDPHSPRTEPTAPENEPVNEAIEDGVNRQISMKRSASGRDSEPDKSENVFHAEQDIPGIKLWNREDKVLVPGKVFPSELAQVLMENRHYAIYVGQDASHMKYPGDVLDLAKPAHRDPWMKELRKLPTERRVMIIDPRSATLPGPRKCPKLSELSSFLRTAHTNARDTRRRVFNAQYTDPCGFTQKRWQSMFSGPLQLSHDDIPNKAHHKDPPLARKEILQQPPVHLAQPPLSTKPARALRRLRSVRYKEASSDPAEFETSSSNSSDAEAFYQSREHSSRRLTPSPSFQSPSASDMVGTVSSSEGDEEERDEKREFLREFFAGSSSENEPSEIPRAISSNLSSGESDEADETAAPESHNQGNIENSKNLSPSSVVILSKASAPVVKRLYHLHESSASEDSLGHVLDGNSFDDVSRIKDGSREDTQEAQEKGLRLKLTKNPAENSYISAEEPHINELDTTDVHSPDPSAVRPSNRSQARQDDSPDSDEASRPVQNDRRDDCIGENDGNIDANINENFKRLARGALREENNNSQSKADKGSVLLQQTASLEVCNDNNNVKNFPIRTTRNSIRNRELIGTNENSRTKHDKNVESEIAQLSTNRSDLAEPLSNPIDAEGVTEGRLRLRQKPRPLDSFAASEGRKARKTNARGPKSAERRSARNRIKEGLEHPRSETKLDGSSDASQTRSERQFLEEVYLWDYSNRTRSQFPMPLMKALEICDKQSLKMIYDGQDLKKGDERFGEIWSDGQAWVSRRGTKSASRKLRVWDHCTGKIERFCFSPPTAELGRWLEDNPENSLYNPSLYVQYERRPALKETTSSNLSILSRVRRVIHDQVLDRIRYLRVAERNEGPQRDVLLWNVLKRKSEPPRDFESRSHLTRFLFANPALELFRGQDALLQLELSTDLRLVHVRKDCPAEVLSFWDTESGKTCARPKELNPGKSWTVQECIDAEPGLTVYLGQDRTDADEVQNFIACQKCSATLQKGFTSRTFYTFVQCGTLMQKSLFSQGWTPKYIDTEKESAAHVAFWSKDRKALQPESFDAALLSIEDHLRSNSDLELYIGQNMPSQVQEQLRRWFHVLSYEPGVDVRKAKPVLIRHGRIPLKYRAVRFTTGEEFRKPRKLQQKRKKRRQEFSERDLNITDRGGKRATAKRPRVSARTNKPSEDRGIQQYSDSSCGEDEAIIDHGEAETTRAHSQEAAHYEDENIDGSSGPGSTATRSNSTFEDGSSEAHSESESSASSTEGPFSKGFPSGEDHVRSATKLAKKMICVIREAGPKVLKRELLKDVRQTLREQLILEVESLEHLAAMVKDFSSHDFVSIANGLCEDLQLLDVHGCFSCNADYGYAPYDLSTLREDFEAGRICTSHEVIKRFREICAGLAQFHEGSLLQAQASLLRLYGERSIARFSKSHENHLQKENRMLRVFRICERAKQIGFVNNQRHRKSKEMGNLLSVGLTEPSLRVRARQPEITFLNYRDEKGNSVMGKRPSVRVFGFTIDTNTLERNAGNIRACHVCRNDVIPSQANSIRCSNSVLNICEEVACRECLETVFSLERNEFKHLRDSENWFCMHCRGLCPSGSDCVKSVATTEQDLAGKTYRRRFVWPFASTDSKSVTIVLSRRHRSGEYEPFSDDCHGEQFHLEFDSTKKTWFTFLNLRIGAYRCQVLVGDDWVASTAFLELPNPTEAAPGYIPEQRPNVPPSSVLYSMGPRPQFRTKSAEFAARVLPRGPRLRWHSVVKHRNHAVHAIRENSAQDGGTLVEQCSRTEGYDWRRAKRHATLQWVPEVRLAEDTKGEKCQDAERDVILCATDDERGYLVAMEKPPTPSIGVSQKDFVVALNTFRYNQMLKSLWSIVTGRSSIHGIGLFTLTGYKKGDFVIEYAGDLIRTPLSDIREARYDAAGLGTYFFKINDEKIVDATVQSNRARFTNHSCDPNMVADIIHVQGRDLVVLRATREIPRFTELTFDYKFPYEEAKVQCLCNAWNCVGVMN